MNLKTVIYSSLILFFCSFGNSAGARAVDEAAAWRSAKLENADKVLILRPQSEAVVKFGENQQSIPELEKPLSDATLKELQIIFENKSYALTNTPEINDERYENIKAVSLGILNESKEKKKWDYTIDPTPDFKGLIVLPRLASFLFDDKITNEQVMSGAVTSVVISGLTGVFIPWDQHHRISGIFSDLLVFDAETGKILWFNSDQTDGSTIDQSLIKLSVQKLTKQLPSRKVAVTKG